MFVVPSHSRIPQRLNILEILFPHLPLEVKEKRNYYFEEKRNALLKKKRAVLQPLLNH